MHFDVRISTLPTPIERFAARDETSLSPNSHGRHLMGLEAAKPTITFKRRLYHPRDVIQTHNGYGARTRPFSQKKPENVQQFWEKDSYYFYDKYRGLPRVNLVAHGAHPTQFDPAGLTVNGRQLNVDEADSLLSELYQERPFHSIRVISCHSACGGEQSLIYQLSDRKKMLVKGYRGKVYGFTPEQVAHDQARRLPFWNGTEAYLGVVRAAEPFVYGKGGVVTLFRDRSVSAIAGNEFFPSILE